jgi:hypothetical protein
MVWGPTEVWVTQKHLIEWGDKNPDEEERLRACIIAGKIRVVAYCGARNSYDRLSKELLSSLLNTETMPGLTLVKEVA